VALGFAAKSEMTADEEKAKALFDSEAMLRAQNVS
jgi:hypothetical protein